jgi:hypothetical protein
MIGASSLPLELAALLTLIVVAAIPNGVWRWAAVLAAARLDDDSPFFSWVRHVATCLVAGVVAQLLLAPSGALAAVPLWLRFGALAIAAALWFAAGRNIFIAWAAGVALLTAGAALI